MPESRRFESAFGARCAEHSDGDITWRWGRVLWSWHKGFGCVLRIADGAGTWTDVVVVPDLQSALAFSKGYETGMLSQKGVG